MSWVYLRFYQRQSGGKEKGDMSDSFTFASFFPEVVRPPIAILANTGKWWNQVQLQGIDLLLKFLVPTMHYSMGGRCIAIKVFKGWPIAAQLTLCLGILIIYFAATLTTSKLLIRSNTNPQNPFNIRNVVILILFQVNCTVNSWIFIHFCLAKFAFFRESILKVFIRDGHNRLTCIFVKC